MSDRDPTPGSTPGSTLRTTLLSDQEPPRLVAWGEVDARTSPRFRAALDAAAEQAATLVLDISRLRFLDSGGIAALFAHRDRIALVLVGPGSAVARALSVTGFPAVIMTSSADTEAGPADR